MYGIFAGAAVVETVNLRPPRSVSRSLEREGELVLDYLDARVASVIGPQARDDALSRPAVLEKLAVVFLSVVQRDAEVHREAVWEKSVRRHAVVVPRVPSAAYARLEFTVLTRARFAETRRFSRSGERQRDGKRENKCRFSGADVHNCISLSLALRSY